MSAAPPNAATSLSATLAHFNDTLDRHLAVCDPSSTLADANPERSPR